MKPKKTVAIACIALLLSITVFQIVFAESFILPEIPGWHNGACKVAELDTVSGNHGFWVERSYRTAEGGAFRATWMSGKGPAFLYPPASGVLRDDGPIGAGATYETRTIGEYGAILENHPTIGLSLILLMSDGILTLESGAYGMGKEQLLEAAEMLAVQIAFR